MVRKCNDSSRCAEIRSRAAEARRSCLYFVTRVSVSPKPCLRIEDVRFGERTLSVHGGKGQKDGTGFFGAETAQALRGWLGIRKEGASEDFLFVDRLGRPLTRDWGTHLVHKVVRKSRVVAQDRTARSATLRRNKHLEANGRP